MSPDAAPVARAASAAAAIAPHAARAEADRRLPPEVVKALVDAGVFKLLLPRELGGAEAGLATLVAVIDRVARADGSAGWCAMIGATSALVSAFLPPETARLVYGPDDAITCGAFAPAGRATRVAGGLRVTGRWSFVSGCEHSAWRMGGVMVEGEASPVHVLLRADETRVVDAWDVVGLRGTGSHDVEATDVLVPDARCFSLLGGAPAGARGAAALPFFGVLAIAVSAVTLGIARSALDALVELAAVKRVGPKRALGQRESVQTAVARAEARLRAAHALLREVADEATAEVAGAAGASLRTRALLRAAAAHATTEAAAVVDAAYEAAGTSAIHARHPLQRHFRDVHVATQHVMVAPASATLAGRVLLGVESDTSTL